MNSKHLNFILIGLFIGAIIYGAYQKSDYDVRLLEYEQEIGKRNKVIAQYERIYQAADSAYKVQFQRIDSIQHKRHENDTITYNFSSDSLKRIWAERFNHH